MNSGCKIKCNLIEYVRKCAIVSKMCSQFPSVVQFCPRANKTEKYWNEQCLMSYFMHWFRFESLAKHMLLGDSDKNTSPHIIGLYVQNSPPSNQALLSSSFDMKSRFNQQFFKWFFFFFNSFRCDYDDLHCFYFHGILRSFNLYVHDMIHLFQSEFNRSELMFELQNSNRYTSLDSNQMDCMFSSINDVRDKMIT